MRPPNLDSEALVAVVEQSGCKIDSRIKDQALAKAMAYELWRLCIVGNLNKLAISPGLTPDFFEWAFQHQNSERRFGRIENLCSEGEPRFTEFGGRLVGYVDAKASEIEVRSKLRNR